MLVNTSTSTSLIGVDGSVITTLAGDPISLFYVLAVINVIGSSLPSAVINIKDVIPQEYAGDVSYSIEVNAVSGLATIDQNTGVLTYSGTSSVRTKMTLSLSATYTVNGLKRIFPLVIAINNLPFDPNITEKLIGYL